MAEWEDEKIYQCDHKIHLEKSETRRSSHVRNIDQSHNILSHDTQKAIMEQRDLKTAVHHGNQSSGLPSQQAPLHLANMESLLFTDC